MTKEPELSTSPSFLELKKGVQPENLAKVVTDLFGDLLTDMDAKFPAQPSLSYQLVTAIVTYAARDRIEESKIFRAQKTASELKRAILKANELAQDTAEAPDAQAYEALQNLLTNQDLCTAFCNYLYYGGPGHGDVQSRLVHALFTAKDPSDDQYQQYLKRRSGGQKVNGEIMPAPSLPLAGQPIIEACFTARVSNETPEDSVRFFPAEAVLTGEVLTSDSKPAHDQFITTLITGTPEAYKSKMDRSFHNTDPYSEAAYKAKMIALFIREFRQYRIEEKLRVLLDQDFLKILEAYSLDGAMAQYYQEEGQELLETISNKLFEACLCSPNPQITAAIEAISANPDSDPNSLIASTLKALKKIAFATDTTSFQKVGSILFGDQELSEALHALADKRKELENGSYGNVGGYKAAERDVRASENDFAISLVRRAVNNHALGRATDQSKLLPQLIAAIEPEDLNDEPMHGVATQVEQILRDAGFGEDQIKRLTVRLQKKTQEEE